MTTVIVIVISLVIGISIVAFVMAMRMSYEKYCIRTRKPFKSWIKD